MRTDTRRKRSSSTEGGDGRASSAEGGGRRKRRATSGKATPTSKSKTRSGTKRKVSKVTVKVTQEKPDKPKSPRKRRKVKESEEEEASTSTTTTRQKRGATKSQISVSQVQPPIGSKYVGAHTSIAGGLDNAVYETIELGGRAFGMFLKSQRQWNSKPLAEKDAVKFKQALKSHGISPNMVLPHGSYLMNLGSPDPEVLKKSREMLHNELDRCERLGIKLFNFHPGSSCGKISVADCVKKIADSINMVHSHTHGSKVITVLENMSCQGNTIGGNFEELRDIIEKVKDKSRVGVCLDTCHTFAAGYDLRSEASYVKTMKEFGRIVGFKYLKAVHLNDSKGELGCHSDRHENIGKGKLGISAFKHLMNDRRFNNIPLILETPGGHYDREVRALYRLCDGKS